MKLRSHKRQQAGSTLFEVLIALAILVASLAPIGQLFSNGLRAAERTRMSSAARFRCESQAAELLSNGGLEAGTQRGILDDNPRWQWTSYTTEETPGLLAVRLRVQHESGAHHCLTFLVRKERVE